ncbi:MAG: Bug family tripartite tricarboxylate transporter substrate binding protein [Pigmentiphaga sp.]
MNWLTSSVPALSLGVLLAVAPTATTATTSATSWPDRPLRLVIPVPAGGGPELIIRTLAEGLQQQLGQPVVVDYRPGAAGNLGAADLAKSPPDGYSWMLAQESIFTINPHIYPNLGFDAADIQPVALIGSFVNTLVCHPSVGVGTLEELIAKAKAEAGKITYASAGSGSPGHLTMEMLMLEAGIKLSHVPYRGPMPAAQDLLGGHVDCAFLVSSMVADHIRAGSLVGLAGSGQKPSTSLPDLPNIANSGYPNFNATYWLGIFAPKGVKPEISEKFQTALQAALADPEVVQAMLASDTQPTSTTPEQTVQRLDQLSQQWSETVKRANVKVE